MNGPSNNDIDRPAKRFDRLEWGMVLAGASVVGGLLIESWQELKLAISEGRFPNLTVAGGVVVTLGVLMEVVLGIFVTQRANRAQAEATERAAKLELDVATQRERAANAERSLLELQQKLADRALATYSGKGGESNTRELEAFAGTKIMFAVLNAEEPQHAAGQLRFVLRQAGWLITSEERPVDLLALSEGVTVLYSGTGEADRLKMSDAAKALARFLEAQHWKANARIAMPSKNLPADVLRIEIGAKRGPESDLPTGLPPEIKDR
jgi:hypothetical protein